LAEDFTSDAAQMTFLVTILPLLVVPALGDRDRVLLQTSAGARRVLLQSEDAATDAYYVTRMGDRFLNLLAKHQTHVDQSGTAEQDRLETAILHAASPLDKALLETTARVNEENRLEAESALSEMRNFVTTLKQAMGAVGSASSCQDLTCGDHAYCTASSSLGAKCLCKDGYQGNGYICKTAMQFAAHPLMQMQQGQVPPRIADIHVSTLQGDTIVAVYRDISNSHKGYALLGHATPNSMHWKSPVLFSDNSKAFNPVIVQLQTADNRKGGIAIAFRSANRGGDGVLLGGRIDPMTGKVTIGSPKVFAQHQAQAMAMLPLSDSRVAVIFAEHILHGSADQPLGGAMYGASLLAQVHSDGASPEIIGKDRFASGPVARLSATLLSPSLLAIAYRLGGTESDTEQAEAACIAGQVHRHRVVFNSPAVLLEPERANIWSRSLTRIGDNLLSYTYHSGNEKVTKQAILQADPKTHRLEVIQVPNVLATGFAPVVSSVALVPPNDLELQKTSLLEHGHQQTARLLTYIGHDGAKPAHVQLCGISSSRIPSGCKELAWAGQDPASMSGAAVSDGRFVFVFTDAGGNAFYQFAGLMDPFV